MSYILDALRRAEAERGRGAVPGLHTPAPSPAGSPPANASQGPRRTAVALAAALLFAAGAAAVAWWAASAPRQGAGERVARAERETTTVASGARLEEAPAAAVPAVPASRAIAEPQSPPPLQPLAPGPASTRSAVVAAPVAVPAPAPATASKAAPKPASAPSPKAAGSAPADAGAAVASVSAPPAPAAAATPAIGASESRRTGREAPPAAESAPPPAPAPAPTVALRDLPDSVRAQFPALQVSGVTYSSNPLYRMAIVNGQVLHEGDSPTQGVVLEGIGPERLVWRFRGYRVAQPAR